MAEYSPGNKEKLAQAAKAEENEPKLSQAYSIGAVIAVGVLGLLGYYIYQRGSPGDNNATKVTPVRSVKGRTRANKFELDYYKMSNINKKMIVNYLYQVAVISVFIVGY